MNKIFNKYSTIFFIFFMSWILLMLHVQKLFYEIPELTTDGASLVIQMLEFTTFRSKELVINTIIYFILLSLNLLYIQYIVGYQPIRYRNFFLSINVVFFIYSIVLSNIFYPITLFIIFLVSILVWSSQKVYVIFSSSYIIYNEGDLIYSSEMFYDEETAKMNLYDWLSNFHYHNSVVGEVISDNNKFYFNIFTKKKLKVARKELFFTWKRNLDFFV